MSPLHQLNIGQLLTTPLANAPDQLVIHGEVSQPYRAVRGRIGRLGSLLATLGVRMGDVVAVMDWDSHRYYECFFAVPMLGAVLHTVNIRLSPEQILYTINHAEDAVILCHADFAPVLAALLPRLARPAKLILLQDAAGPPPEGIPWAGEYEALLAGADPGHSFQQFDETTRATLFYTTGTTGDPKGVTFTHRQLVLHTLSTAAACGTLPDGGGVHRADVYMPVTPLFHVHAWGMPYLATMLGLKQIYPGRYEPTRLLRLIETHGVTFSHCVPTILNMLLTAPDSDKVDLSGWKVIIGGAALPAGLAEAALARGIRVRTGYGMSETCPVLSVSDTITGAGPDRRVYDVPAGRAIPLVELALQSETMETVAHDGLITGEVVARAPWLTEAYLNNPAGSEALWRDGWLHTGDIGTIDSTGTLRIGDRLKDVIKSGGEWLSSLELENLASRVSGVAEVAAFGLPDVKWGERPVLALVLAAGTVADGVKAAVHAAICAEIAAGRLPKWADPERIVIVESLCKTSVGKLDKKRMRVELAG